MKVLEFYTDKIEHNTIYYATIDKKSMKSGQRVSIDFGEIIRFNKRAYSDEIPFDEEILFKVTVEIV